MVPEVITEEIAKLREAGGRAVVELTCGGLKPNPEGLAEIARKTDMQIIMGCGYYVEEYQNAEAFARSIDDFAAEMTGQVLDGAWGTDIRAGIIGEIGCQSPWTDQEKK